jgi:putative ABC transport system permease protein
MARADRRLRLQIAWRSLRWRMGTTLVMLAVATVGIAAGTFGPIYLGGADQSILQATLRGAFEANSGLSLLATSNNVALTAMDQAIAAVPRQPHGRALYRHAIFTADRPVTTLLATQPYAADLISRTGACGHLSFSSGHCPTGTGTVAVSTRSAKELGLHLGGPVKLQFQHLLHPITFTIAGLFRTPDPFVPYWWGFDYFGFGSGSSGQPDVDDFIASQSTVLAIPAANGVPLLAQLPLLNSRLTTGNVGQFQSELASYEHHSSSLFGVQASTPLPSILATASSDEHTTGTIVEVVLAQLILLALLILYSVAARSAESRDPDVRLAELRGFPLAGRASVALLEPAAVLTAALPLGVVVAWLIGVVGAGRLFPLGGTPSVGLLAIGGALLAYAAGLISTVLGARGLVRRPQLEAAGPGRIHRRASGVALDAIIVAVAVAAFVEVAISGVSAGRHTDPLAALAPGLLAFGLGVAGARLVPLLAWSAISPTRNSHRAGISMAVRRLSRLPQISRHVVVLAIAVGLATFAVSGWAVAGNNRSVQATFEVGASRVLTVDARPGVDFLDAVRRADPSGREAMAVVVENASDGSTLAVDSSRFAAVASWPLGLSTKSAATIATKLSRAPGPPVTVSGSAIRVSVDLLKAITPAPQLQLSLFDDGYQVPSTLSLGGLRPGSHQYHASMAGSCSPTCQLVGLNLTWFPGANSNAQSVEVPLRVTNLTDRSSSGAWRPVRAGLNIAHRWVGEPGLASVSATAAGLSVHANVQVLGGATTFGPNDLPDGKLPAVVVGTGFATVLGVGLDGATISLQPFANVDALPGVGSNGASMVDLRLAELMQNGPMLYTTEQVWLAPGAPNSIVARLKAAGVTVTSEHTAAQRDGVLSRTGISLAYTFFLLAAVMAAVLAVASTAFVLVAAARRRVGELSALQAVGVSRTVLRRAMLMEQFAVVAVGIIMGIVAGALAVAAALHSIPEFISVGAGPPLDFGLPFGDFAVVVLAVLVALVATVGLIARLVVGRAPGDTVGEEGA